MYMVVIQVSWVKDSQKIFKSKRSPDSHRASIRRGEVFRRRRRRKERALDVQRFLLQIVYETLWHLRMLKHCTLKYDELLDPQTIQMTFHNWQTILMILKLAQIVICHFSQETHNWFNSIMGVAHLLAWAAKHCKSNYFWMDEEAAWRATALTKFAWVEHRVEGFAFSLSEVTFCVCIGLTNIFFKGQQFRHSSVLHLSQGVVTTKPNL